MKGNTSMLCVRQWVGTEMKSCKWGPGQLVVLPVIMRKGRMDMDRRQRDVFVGAQFRLMWNSKWMAFKVV